MLCCKCKQHWKISIPCTLQRDRSGKAKSKLKNLLSPEKNSWWKVYTLQAIAMWHICLKHITSTASALQRRSSGTDSAQIPRELDQVKTCTELLKSVPAKTVDAKPQLLIEITTNRLSPEYASAFLGCVLTFQEIATIDRAEH